MEAWFPEDFDVEAWTAEPRARGRTRHVDLLLATLADLQHGVSGTAQLRSLLVTRHQIQARIDSGHLHPLRPGVHSVGRSDTSPKGRRMGAVLAGGHRARLAGWSGATQSELLPEAGTRIDIAIPAHRHVALEGIDAARVRDVSGEVITVDGIPTHTVARVLLDLAARADDPDLVEWAWRQAVYRKTLHIPAIERILGDHDGEPGTPALRRLYVRRASLVGTLRNRFELLMLSIIREAGLPDPLCNVPYEVAPGLVLTPDFRFPALRLVLESDGRDGHDDVEFLLTDGQRDALYEGSGDEVLRFTYWQAKRERGRVVGDLKAVHRRLAGR
jgi:hypothetical protein